MWSLRGLPLVVVVVAVAVVAGVAGDITFSPDSFKVCVNERKDVTVRLTDDSTSVTVKLVVDHENHIEVSDKSFVLSPSNREKTVTVTGLNPGKIVLSAEVDDDGGYAGKCKASHIIVQKQDFWNVISDIVGWLYFVAWSVSFYPQMYENWKRKSVVGLNFDFLSLNLLGFFLYSLFNIGLFSSELVQSQYEARYPKGVIPVQLNDIFFSVHAAVAVILTGIQCFLYERGDQTISRFARCLFVFYALFLGISLVLAAATDVMNWLDFLLFCSYVKLSITLIKYVPQAYMNYKRKSTVGWSIGNIFLDLSGGLLSMIQMMINANNFDDWASIFGDPTKFGLGLFSVMFDIFFIVQHYVLYRHTTELPI